MLLKDMRVSLVKQESFVVTSGPGATNAITGITDAYSDSFTISRFTGQVATPGIGKDAFQEADLLDDHTYYKTQLSS